MKKATWYQWHHWLGVKLSILLCFILASGTLAVISHELDWLTQPNLRAKPTPYYHPIPWGQVYSSIKLESPTDRLLSLSAPIHQGFAIEGIAKRQSGDRYRIYLDPTDGKFQGIGPWYNWQTVLRRLHRHLMLPATLGITIVSFCAFIFLGLLFSGLILHPKWASGLIQWPRRKNPRIFWGDLHRLAGLWSSWLVLIVSITGVWYLAERWGLDAAYPEDAKPISDYHNQSSPLPSQENFDRIVKQARALRPELKIKFIRFPQNARQSLVVEGQANNLLVRNRANNMTFDPNNGTWLSSRHAENLSLHVRISEAADPLHFGIWGGYPTKIIYFIFGLILTSVAISGTYIFALRQAKMAKNEPLISLNRWGLAWQNMGKLRWIALGGVLLALGFIPFYIL
ncbi:peptidase [Microbulbifer sp. A4B17]|uniref:PepSY-associated TM helix domain-containing protein n=1 Tax=Microbulbifer sp. A4B17 TaxID=359370 RepID=UPI000D52C806|nr:PepSY-associated TM helix domain-containing protein [Microbulbifer sp. A4B17]AWF81593.1 peptidase [Microbulbifer sp. A4B17]